jgi:hypothetical protein
MNSIKTVHTDFQNDLDKKITAIKLFLKISETTLLRIPWNAKTFFFLNEIQGNYRGNT